jgi:O-antigen ligase
VNVAQPGRVGSTVGSPAAVLLVLGAAATWWTVSGLGGGSRTADAVGLILAVACALVIAWVAAERWPAAVLTGIVGACAAVVLADAGGSLHSGPTQGPFGYANATAAFAAQACVAALLLVVVAHGPLRAIGAVAAISFVPLVLATRSWTVLLLLPTVVGAALVVERWRDGRSAVVLCAGLFGGAVAITIALGALGISTSGGALDRVIEGTISAERVALWNDALATVARHPVLGVGPGGFAQSSATASSDPDLRWAHNEFLQAGAEVGLIGYGLAVAVFVWGFAALGRGSWGRVMAVSAAGLAVLGIQACVDYVLHFPFLVVVGAAVLGAGLGAARGAPALKRPITRGVAAGGSP